MKIIKVILTMIVIATAINCTDKKSETNNSETSKNVSINYNELLIGSWVEKNPIDENEVQRIEILKDGKAKSINMATLLYKNWSVKNDSLFLIQESIGNKTSSIDTFGYKINTINKNQLILSNKDLISTYRKQ